MIKFGTGGWRAVIGDDFTKANIQLLAQGLVNKMKSEGVTEQGIVMGYDRRFLSKEAMQWAAEVFAAAQIKAYLINKSSPTPLVMFYVMKHDFPYGMMITASHNPAIYNGIKVFTAGGRDADEIQTKDLEDYIADIASDGVCAVAYEDGKAALTKISAKTEKKSKKRKKSASFLLKEYAEKKRKRRCWNRPSSEEPDG